jgi:hypothetical protein
LLRLLADLTAIAIEDRVTAPAAKGVMLILDGGLELRAAMSVAAIMP